ncbi:amidohydrolase [Candidatus Heimdallarchaeota archaeon]|nr:MAG: amidohydrolase [Candidatus Heimdallarchaeota archaeon]
MSDLFLKCKYIIAGSKCEKLIREGAILIEEDKIVAVGKEEEVKKLLSGHDMEDRSHHIAIPSLINGHTHLPETLLRGICDNQKLMVWLNEYIWPFEMKMSEEDAYYGALLGCLELIESGVGGFIDQYFYAESIEKAAKKANIRALLCPSIFNNTPESGSIEKTWNHVSSLLELKCKNNKGLVKYGIGPHAPYTVPKEYLLKIFNLASKYSIPIHIHLNETKREVDEAKENFGLTPIEYIQNLGLDKAKILAAHCVHTSPKEWKIMKDAEITVLHNPQSNLKMTSGIAPVYKYIEQQIDVVVGTDGNASNNDLGMLEELATTAMLQKYLANNPEVLKNAEVLTLGTINGLKAMGIDSFGISENSPADLTLLSLDRSHSWPQNNPLSNVIYSSSSSDVSDLIVNGTFVYRSKKHLTLDKSQILEKCTEISQRILHDIGK